MAKKKGKRPGNRSGRRKSHEVGFGELPFLPDPRSLEGLLRQIRPEASPKAPKGASRLERAQDLIYEAFEAEGEERIRLAEEALEVSPDCADAYVLLAEHCEDLKDAIALYTEGVAAGERALGKEAFREYAGHFWQAIETRPYMRARLGLAQSLREVGRRDEAVAHFDEILRLNPNDNQGVRYVLASCLLDLNRDAELALLLDDYCEDDSAAWLYTRALTAFRSQGDSPQARKWLTKGAKANKHVPAYLLGTKTLPQAPPEFLTMGGEDEAISYTFDFLPGWRRTAGALGWLRQTLQSPLRPAGTPRKSSWTAVRSGILRLPQEMDEGWQIDFRPVPGSEEGRDSSVPAWLFLVVSTTGGSVVNVDFADEEPTARDLWEYLLETMRRPKEGEPRRPQQVAARPEVGGKWKAKLKQIGVEFVPCDAPGIIDELMEVGAAAIARLAEQNSQESPPEEVPGDWEVLPQNAGEAWQADVRKFPGWVGDRGNPQRPWLAVVTNRSDDLVLGHDMRMEAPDVEWLWECLSRAMTSPAVGEPHRPGVIELASREYAAIVKPRLEAAGVECVVSGGLEHLDSVLADMARHVGDPKPLAGLVDVPGMTLEQLAGFYAAAAEFYRRSPWRDVPGDTPIRVECPKFQSGPWYAVVMGQMGMTLGLALYEDLDMLRAMLSGTESEEEGARRTSGLSLMYGEAFEIPISDLDAVERHGWPVAAPEAYPQAIRVNPGRAIRPALPWELELLEGSLKAIPGFRAAGASPREEIERTAKGELPLRLSWLDDAQDPSPPRLPG